MFTALNWHLPRAARSEQLLAVLRGAAIPLDVNELADNAIVFAPHQDDEALGCGGTILKKVAAGARVSIAFMTDGSAMLHDPAARRELAAKRRAEALAATAILKISPECTHFLDFQDGYLAQHQTTAVARVLDLLETIQPRQIFVPILGEGHPDHVATRKAVLKAARKWGRELAIYEYPIWFWFTSPHVKAPELSFSLTGLRKLATWSARAVAKQLWASRYIRSKVEIGDVIDLKRAAIAIHSSQQDMLTDVGDGEFRAIFERPFELFRKLQG